MHQSLVASKSAYPLVVFATPELPQEAREVLQHKGIAIRDIAYLQPGEEHRTELDEHDKRFADTWTKLRCFELTEYEVNLQRGLH